VNRRTFVSNLAIGGTALLTAPSHASAALVCSAVSPTVEACTAGIRSSLANISMSRPQQQSNWCWAACIQMVFRYNGLRISQAKIVEEVFGARVNQPGEPEQIVDALNRTWTDEDNDNYDVEGDIYTVSPGTAAQDLAADFPLIIGSLGHAMVLSAVSFYRDAYGNGQIVNAMVRDPWPGRGLRQITAAEWIYMSFAVRIRVTS